MRVLVLSFYYEPDLCAGSFRAKSLVEQLVNNDINVDVVTTMPNRYASFPIDAEQYEEKHCLKLYRVPLSAHKSGFIDQAKAFYDFYRGARRIVKNKDYDLVFATSSRLFTAYLGARVASKKSVPLYLDIRDIFTDTLESVLSPALSKVLLPIFNLVEKYTFNKAQKVNLVSGGFSDFFRQRYPKIPFDNFTNGIDEEFLGLEESTANESAEKSERKTILYAGNIGEGQGLHRIIPELGLSLGKEYKILIVGDGGRKEKLTTRLAELSVDNVEVLAPVKRDKLIELYQQADILFLHLNDFEAFKKVIPSKIFEYAVFQKTILAGVSGFAAKFIQENVTDAEIFPPCDVNRAIAALSKSQRSIKPRTEFVNLYSRKNIMKNMVCSITELT